MSVGLDDLQGLYEGLTTVAAIPSTVMSMPLNVEAIGAGPIEADEGGVELFAKVFSARSGDLDQPFQRIPIKRSGRTRSVVWGA